MNRGRSELSGAGQELVIRHAGGESFSVIRLSDGKSTDAVTVGSPVGFPVKDRPQSGMLRELRWYLEDFLDYPFSPGTEHA